MADPADDARWMTAALAFGRRGFGSTAPNPCVAVLVVRDGVIVGRGVTAPGGRPHAEPQALAQAGEAARGATMVVTLEPCSHHGRTPPCVDAIIAAGIARVVVACGDPDARVAGRGIDQLRHAGIEVVSGVGAAAARRDHVGHIRRVIDHRPGLTLKLAETADGIAAAPPGQPRLMITGPVANAWVHVARSMHDAVLIGRGTAHADDPQLTVRFAGLHGRQPVRVVLDRDGVLDPMSRLAATAGAHPVVCVTRPDLDPAKADPLRQAGVDVAGVALGPDGRLDLRAAMVLLADRGITRVFCEGGPRLGAALLAGDLVDEVDLLTAAHRFDGPGLAALDEPARATLCASGRFAVVEDRMIGDDRLRQYERQDECSPD